MVIRRWNRPVAFGSASLLIVLVTLAGFAVRNTLSIATIVGQWHGYALQQSGPGGPTAPTRVPLAFTFQPDGIVIRGQNLTRAKYEVADNALVFYDIQSPNASKRPVLWNARIVSDTLTLSGDAGPIAVLRRVP